MPVLFVKTTMDEDIVAEVEEIPGMQLEDGVYQIPAAGLKLKAPARLMATHQGLGMMPLNPFIKDEYITIPKSFIVYIATPDDGIKNAWNEKFGSGIVIAPPGLQLG